MASKGTGDWPILSKYFTDVSNFYPALTSANSGTTNSSPNDEISEEYFFGAPISFIVDAGVYTVTGQAVSLRKSWILTCDTGSYSITGQATGLRKSWVLACNTGTCNVTGQAASLKKQYVISCSSGSYNVTGQNTSLSKSWRIICNTGTYNVTGNSAIVTGKLQRQQ